MDAGLQHKVVFSKKIQDLARPTTNFHPSLANPQPKTHHVLHWTSDEKLKVELSRKKTTQQRYHHVSPETNRLGVSSLGPTLTSVRKLNKKVEEKNRFQTTWVTYIHMKHPKIYTYDSGSPNHKQVVEVRHKHQLLWRFKMCIVS